MEYCLYNAIKTPDGTVLWCESGHDFKTHKDSVSGETYMNDGRGWSIRRSVNVVPYEDLSISLSDPFEKIRTAKFWGSYGKDGKSKKIIMALEDMEDSHIQAILDTQKQIEKEVRAIFLKELEFRLEKKAKETMEDLGEVIPKRQKKKKLNV